MFPFLSLKDISIHVDLARRLPRRLAYYHLALPIARDVNSITVAMGIPDNLSVIRLLEAVLNSPVIAVCSPKDEISTVLDQIWTSEAETGTSQVIVWSQSRDRLQWVRAYAEMFSKILCAETKYLESGQSRLENVLRLATQEPYLLLVIDESPKVGLLLRNSPAPVLLVRGEPRSLDDLLFVSRGHAPDYAALEWVILLARSFDSRVTLLVIGQATNAGYPITSRFAEILSPESEKNVHLASLTQIMTAANIRGHLKLREGIAEDEIAAEVVSGEYDLMIIAAEAFGDFVHGVLKAIQQINDGNTIPVLVVKPNV